VISVSTIGCVAVLQFTQNNGTKRREAWIRTIHTKQWYTKKRGMDKNNSHKTMVQKEERHG
jgi:hypothetical protein